MKTKMVTQDLRSKIVFCAFLSFLFTLAGPVFADEIIDPYFNDEEEVGVYAPAYAPMSAITLPFDPNNYMFLIYESPSGENSILAALAKIGIPSSHYTVCDKDNPVTPNLLDSHDILIVGWESSGDTGNKAGLVTSAIEQGITGRVILSGHDSDYHTVNEEDEDAGTTFFIQEIEYILNGGGTGLLVCADPQRNLDWLPESWSVTANSDSGTQITSITQNGLDSGVFDNLTKELMSDWSTTYHNTFTAWGDGFKVFELGEANTSEIGYDVVTIAAPINPMGFDLDKYDDIADGNCVNIDDPIKYTIEWHNTTEQTFYDAYIKDIFPVGVNYTVAYTFDPNTWQFISSDPGYDEETHTYTYPIGAIPPNDSGILQLDVVVNNLAVPGYYLHNVAELWATVYDANGLNPVERLIATAYEDTLACCWDTEGILYVDQNAAGNNTGVSWTDAYTSLDSALTRARETQCTFDYIIYVAQGTYPPTDTENGFVLPENVSVYGGFPTGGSDFADRNPKRYETILTGLIDEDEFPDADVVVSMGSNTLIGGFTVTKALTSAISGVGVNFVVEHCVIKDNFQFGVNTTNCNTEIRWTTVISNGKTGLYHQGEGYQLTVDNSWCLRNGEHGIFCLRSTPFIRNSIISESSLVEQGRSGIHIEYPKFQPKLFNLTIANNKAAGVFFEDDGDADGDPNNLDYPDLQNSILYFNNNNNSQITGFDPDVYANFCCIQDCNTIGTTNFPDTPGFAYMAFDPNGMPDPNGVPDPNNYHLAANSICIDRANPFLDYTAQVDIDGEGLDRKYGDYVDIGADEVYNCEDGYVSEADVHNDLDWDADGMVNLVEFNAFSRAWLSRSPDEYIDPNLIDPNEVVNWNPKCNLADTGSSQFVIDLDDLEIFLEDWLWIACWKLEEINAMTAMMTGGEEQMQALSTGFAVQRISEPETIQPEPTVEEQILQLQDAIEFLEQIWLEEPDLQQEINAKDWRAFMDAIYENLADIKTEAIQIE
jgi:hypothetical protein